MDIYSADPFDNRSLWEELFGEETVNEMTQTGDATETRSLFPRVNFRDVQDAELVAECLRESTISMGKRAANNVKVWATANEINKMGIVEAAILTGKDVSTEPGKLLTDQCEAIRRMLGMIEAVTAQLSAMYGTPTQDNAKYVSDLLQFVTETREFVGAMEMCVDEMSKTTGEQ